MKQVVKLDIILERRGALYVYYQCTCLYGPAGICSFDGPDQGRTDHCPAAP